jgi:hypothetical protein
MTEPKTNGSARPIDSRPRLEPITIDGDYPDFPNTCSPTAASSATNDMDMFDEIIPHPDEVHHRNLVLCFDGTGDQFDGDVIFLYISSATSYLILYGLEFEHRRILLDVKAR